VHRVENRQALGGGGAVDPIEHEAMQMDVEIGGRSEALDERDGAGVGFGALESGLLDQKCGNDPVDDLQDGREQLRMCSEQQAKRDRKHPLAHRHPGDDVLDQVGSGFRHASGATARAEAATLATEGHGHSRRNAGAGSRGPPGANMPHSRKASNSSLTNSGKPDPVSSSTWQEGLEVFLYQLVEGGVFGTPPLVVDAPSRRRRLNHFAHCP